MTTDPGAVAVAEPGPPSAAPPLRDVLHNRRWVRRTHPFPHVVAQGVFTDDFYARLHAEFGRVEAAHPEAFLRAMPGYDASGADLANYRAGPLGVFLGREWHDAIAAAAGVETPTGDVAASLHHHDPGGASGWPHNDLNPGWFGGPPPARDEVRLNSDHPIDYHHGTRPDGTDARLTVRAVSVLFYLGNPAWNPGDGGETGLFRTRDRSSLELAVPPVNNSLVIFECTPFSWHSFVSNRVSPRNSVVMWLHRDPAEVEQRWGEQSIVQW